MFSKKGTISSTCVCAAPRIQAITFTVLLCCCSLTDASGSHKMSAVAVAVAAPTGDEKDAKKDAKKDDVNYITSDGYIVGRNAVCKCGHEMADHTSRVLVNESHTIICTGKSAVDDQLWEHATALIAEDDPINRETY